LGALTNSYPRTRSVKLDFLAPGKWKMRFWHDTRRTLEVDPEDIQIEERTVSAGDTLDILMAGGGGAVAHFVPVR